jgi:hypothetical protein
MKILLSLALVFSVVLLNAQTKPSNFTEETNPNNSNFEFYSQKSDSSRRSSFTNMKKNMVPDVNTVAISYVPALTGNSSNKTQFVQTAGDSIYYIDGYGDAFLLYDPIDSVLTGSISGDTLYLNNLELLLSTYRQTIDTFSLSGSTLSLSLSGDSEAAKIVDLSSLGGGGAALTSGMGVSVAGDSVSIVSDTIWSLVRWLTTSNFFRINPINTETFFFSDDDRIYVGSASNKIDFRDTTIEFSIDEIGGNTGAFVVDDNRSVTQGIIYDGDYSAGFVDRSLVDKGYVDEDKLSMEITAADTAVVYEILLVNVTSTAVIVTPPVSPSVGDWFSVSDSRGNAGTNNITIDFDGVGVNLHGGSADHVISANKGFARFTYINSTVGWIVSN